MNEEQRKFVEDNLGLAQYFSRRYGCYSMTYEDIYQEAVLGLIAAAEKFDPKCGVKFSVLAHIHIRRAVMEAIDTRNDMIRTPRKRNNIVVEQVGNWDDSIPDHDRGELGSMEDYPEPERDEDDEPRDFRFVEENIRMLPERQAIVVRLRYGINTDAMTLKEVGNVLGVTAERVRQIQNVAEGNLRTIIENDYEQTS